MTGGAVVRVKVDGVWSGPCTVKARIGQNPDGSYIWKTTSLIAGSGSGGGGQVAPPAPTLSGSMPTRTSTSIAWAVDASLGGSPVTSWEVQRRQDGGAWASVTGSPFAATVNTLAQTGLATNTPEILWEYQVRGINNVGIGDWSTPLGLQWQTVVQGAPTPPTNTSWGEVTDTTAWVTWDATADPAAIDQRITDGTTVLASGIAPGVRQFKLTGLRNNTDYTTVQVSRRNSTGFSTKSPAISFRTSSRVIDPVMGCQNSPNDHGARENWGAWRVNSRSALLQLANRTTDRPQILLYSVDGTPLGSAGNTGVSTMTYAAIFNYVKGELDNFYYGGTGQTRSARWGVKIYWQNGNENSDKGILATPHTQTSINNFVTSQQALYDACHLIDPATGVRRYPDAFAGSDPTQDHELSGIVADWLHPSAKFHDFVSWSFYPPGRNSAATDPRYDWPSFKEADRTDRQNGYLIRCFYRTKAAQTQARSDLNDPTFEIAICCGEVGIASDPGDMTTRPYYACHAIIGGMVKLAQQYDLSLDAVSWWDQKSSATSPHNILTDEPPNSDHGGDNTKTANPSTAEAWQNWRKYNKQFGGSAPAQWSGAPKATWTTTGQVI